MCDKHNLILDKVVVPRNTHDSKIFGELYNKITKKFSQIKVITADAEYKIPWICKQILDDGRIPSLSYKRLIRIKK